MRKRRSNGIKVYCRGGSSMFLFSRGEDIRRRFQEGGSVFIEISGGPRGMPF